MASHPVVIPSREFRAELHKRGGETATRCYQCATCTSVCELAPDDEPFPRREMLWAQWGLADRIAADPGVWLCHQCNDCTTRCPRDAKPGDVMAVARSMAVEKLAFPGFMGTIVGKASITWPLLLGAPFAFWIIVLYLIHGFTIPEKLVAFHQFVPLWLIYLVFFGVTGAVGLAMLISGVRFWKLLGTSGKRSGSFIGKLIPAAIEVATHSRFGKCGTAKPRRWGHFALMWGFVLAALASGLIIVYMYVLKEELPVPFWHWMKIVGNVGAIFLLVGAFLLLVNRLRPDKAAGASTAYDNFFLAVVILVVATGILAEAGRLTMDAGLACWIYLIHLTSVLALFVTFPYSKFAHLVYRTLAMVHEKMTVKK